MGQGNTYPFSDNTRPPIRRVFSLPYWLSASLWGVHKGVAGPFGEFLRTVWRLGATKLILVSMPYQWKKASPLALEGAMKVKLGTTSDFCIRGSVLDGEGGLEFWEKEKDKTLEQEKTRFWFLAMNSAK
ncbi:hypothetical protein AVEN_212154-1 [Araneus ventricosus]|uniref:Uncharacterized protein n=1 Tax=Araneus ventricosus TaxID=182803 RepID=A0A4Y2BB09_ARAVE|nr:hypothetical protein AVEN_212154-1 [Araneus ventricosus]